MHYIESTLCPTVADWSMSDHGRLEPVRPWSIGQLYACILIGFYPILSVSVQFGLFCLFLSIAIKFCPFLTVMSPSVNFFPFLSVFVVSVGFWLFQSVWVFVLVFNATFFTY